MRSHPHNKMCHLSSHGRGNIHLNLSASSLNTPPIIKLFLHETLSIKPENFAFLLFSPLSSASVILVGFYLLFYLFYSDICHHFKAIFPCFVFLFFPLNSLNPNRLKFHSVPKVLGKALLEKHTSKSQALKNAFRVQSQL